VLLSTARRATRDAPLRCRDLADAAPRRYRLGMPAPANRTVSTVFRARRRLSGRRL